MTKQRHRSSIDNIFIADKTIDSVVFYKVLPPFLRLDILPFTLFYVTACYVALTAENNNSKIFFGCFLFIGFFHILVFLSSQWSVDIMCWFTCREVADLTSANFAKVKPILGSKQLCRIERSENSTVKNANLDELPAIWFAYQKIIFGLYQEEKNEMCFRRLKYPIKKNIEYYAKWVGYTNENDVDAALTHWGSNVFDIPIPTFIDLFKEHAIAPFFVFQVFCMLLWCLDEYWYYSLFTLFMLVVFECTVVKQRQRNMETLRNMRRPPQPLHVYRCKQWSVMNSDNLVPGDICSIKRHQTARDSQDEILAPCDVLLLAGSCVVNEAMLSGESVPLRKQSILTLKDSYSEILQVEANHKGYVVFGGTKVLQHTLTNESGITREFGVPRPPDGGCPAFVLRTGFGTTQGNLMRTILFASERVTANSAETFMFILVLLAFAVVAAAKVLLDGLEDEGRNRFKLILRCIMIITSVVPPELPMELSLAVTNSLVSLSLKQIFCTEPYRIPFAGKVDVCCFDKTGTLTSDDFVMRGVAGIGPTNQEAKKLHLPTKLDPDTEHIIAGCHSLVFLDDKMEGDPLEIASVKEIGWTLTRQDCMLPPSKSNSGCKLRILHRFAFSSELKRMSTVVRAESSSVEPLVLLSKGAPEVMKDLFETVPEYYDEIQRRFTSKGCRVLALGRRDLADTIAEIRSSPRDVIEKRLSFCGFLVLDCPLKVDSKKTIKHLIKSRHRVVMITGDNSLTACDVARQVGIMSQDGAHTLILYPNDECTEGVEWVAVDDGQRGEPTIQRFDIGNISKLSQTYDLCVTGAAISTMQDILARGNNWTPAQQALAVQRFVEQICSSILVFARTSPQQKEKIIAALNSNGRITAMCGDGTNDVGALKQAHVGISIINNPELEISVKNKLALENASVIHESQSTKTGLRNRKTKQTSLEKRQRRLDQMAELVAEEELLVKFGDASIASPFTSKSPSIRVTEEIIRQGRCTLVTTLQMFKILGVNCLISAYMLSILYTNGVKQGDQQMTIVGVAVALFFLFLSRSQPTTKLSSERPANGVFAPSIILSIVGQFVIHLVCLIKSVELALPFVDKDDPGMHPDGKFSSNVINSTVFLVSSIMQVNTFIVNYKGHPFMQSLRENTALWRSALVCYVLLYAAAIEIISPINDLLELAPFPSTEMKIKLVALMVGDTLGVIFYESILQKVALLSE